MNRRSAINRLLLIGGGAALTFSGYMWFEQKKTPDLDYLERQKGLLASLAGAVIPATDTPGATAANITGAMIMLIRECTPVESQNQFIDGLQSIERVCKSKYQRGFQDCTADEQNHVLASYAHRGLLEKVERRFRLIRGRTFFETLRQVVAIGYCTSEVGATRGLAYDYIPGKYLACIPMAADQKSWALR